MVFLLLVEAVDRLRVFVFEVFDPVLKDFVAVGGGLDHSELQRHDEAYDGPESSDGDDQLGHAANERRNVFGCYHGDEMVRVATCEALLRAFWSWRMMYWTDSIVMSDAATVNDIQKTSEMKIASL